MFYDLLMYDDLARITLFEEIFPEWMRLDAKVRIFNFVPHAGVIDGSGNDYKYRLWSLWSSTSAQFPLSSFKRSSLRLGLRLAEPL